MSDNPKLVKTLRGLLYLNIVMSVWLIGLLFDKSSGVGIVVSAFFPMAVLSITAPLSVIYTIGYLSQWHREELQSDRIVNILFVLNLMLLAVPLSVFFSYKG